MSVVAGAFVPVPFGVGRGVHEVVPWCRECRQAVSLEGLHEVDYAAEVEDDSGGSVRDVGDIAEVVLLDVVEDAALEIHALSRGVGVLFRQSVEGGTQADRHVADGVRTLGVLHHGRGPR